MNDIFQLKQIHKCIFAVSENNFYPILIKSEPSLFENQIFSSNYMDENIPNELTDSLPKEVGVFSCDIEILYELENENNYLNENTSYEEVYNVYENIDFIQITNINKIL